jgi:hypothetical protein
MAGELGHVGCGLVGISLAWERELIALKDRLAPVFRRSDVAASAGAFIDGLLSYVGPSWNAFTQMSLG